MKKIGFLAIGLFLFQVLAQGQCDVNYQAILSKYCSGHYLIHHELNNQNSVEATLILHKDNTYNIYLLKPSHNFRDFQILFNDSDISAEFEIIKEGEAAVYQLAADSAIESRFSFITQTNIRSCVMLAIFLQPGSDIEVPGGLYKSFTELKFRDPSYPYFFDYTRKRSGSLVKKIYHYKLNLGLRERREIGEIYAFNDGTDTYFNINALSRGIEIGHGRIFAKAEDLYEYYFIEYYSAAIVPTHTGTIYADSWQKMLVHKETGQIMKLNRTILKQILENDPELLEEFHLESNKSKKLKTYLYRYSERMIDRK